MSSSRLSLREEGRERSSVIASLFMHQNTLEMLGFDIVKCVEDGGSNGLFREKIRLK